MLSDPDISPLVSETMAALSGAISSTVRQSDMPAAMRAKLERSTFIFSGFKTHAELSAVSRLLSKDGVKTPFDTFMREVKAVNQDYNVNYLRAEYNFAVHSSRSAALWERFSKDADRYYLQYRTAGDERVREDHRPLHDITLPFDDPFWAEYFPPNGWNCRCTAVRVRRSKYTPSDHDKAMAAGERATTSLDKHGNNRAAIFRFNPGAQETLFPPRHPYYKTPDKKAVADALNRISIDDMVAELPDNLSKVEKQAIAKQNIDLEQKLGVTKGKRMTIDEADKQSANPNRDKGREYRINCQTCAPAYMLRIRGFDVTAKANRRGTKLEYLSQGYHVWEAWKNIDGSKAIHRATSDWMASKGYKLMNPKRYREFFEEVCSEPGIYELSIGWKGSSGHATILQRLDDGRLLYIEPQHDNSANRTLDYLCNNGEGKPHGCRGIMRIDNKLFNTDFVEIFDK